MAVLAVTRDAPQEGRRRAATQTLRLDGVRWLRVTDEELAELGLREGEVVDDGRRASLEERLHGVRAWRFVLRSLAARAQSIGEIEAKLAHRGVPAVVARVTVERACGYGFLDDAALAAQLARAQREGGIGRRRAERTLARRLLPRAVRDEALAEAYDAADETADALAALGQRSFGEGDAGRRKAAAFLARRGFSGHAAWTAVHARERAGSEE